MPSPFPCSPVIRECSWKKTQIQKKPVQEVAAIQATATTFQINNAKPWVPVVSLSINDNKKFLENVKIEKNKRTISLNRYRSEITRQPKDNNLNYLIDLKFMNINRLFVLLFKNGNNDPTINSSDKYYMPLVEIKSFNALIENKTFLISK